MTYNVFIGTLNPAQSNPQYKRVYRACGRTDLCAFMSFIIYYSVATRGHMSPIASGAHSPRLFSL